MLLSEIIIVHCECHYKPKNIFEDILYIVKQVYLSTAERWSVLIERINLFPWI